MEAHSLWMLKNFIGANGVLFKIPVYQRNYDWAESNCDRLLDDIKAIIGTDEKHFIGAIVYMLDKHKGFSLSEYIIIDGQQRLTTMMLILKALSDIAKVKQPLCHEQIEKMYLHNQFCDEEFKIKLKPIKTDNEQFTSLLKNKSLDKNCHIFKNYSIIIERLQKWVDSGIEPSSILDALSKLEIVEIVLEKGVDDPQIIFESMNSTGLDLSNADLIRNFLLMSAANQEDLYENYWLEIEKRLKNGTDYSDLNNFFLQYITYKTNTPITSAKLYEKFVKLFKDGQYTQQRILAELDYYSKIYKAFVYSGDLNKEDENRPNYDVKVLKNLQAIRKLKQTTCYPFLLHVFDDFEKGSIDKECLQKVTWLVLSYLLRRIVCGVPSNSLRGFCIYLYSRIFKVVGNKKKYYESINKFLATLTSRDVFPSDSEFRRSLKTANIYANPVLCKYLLSDIENGDGKEKILMDDLTIEHIMPQTLNIAWKHIATEEHEQYLHTLGNLTITGYNSELSNKSFEEKLTIIKPYSKANELNSDVINKTVWNIDCIKSRAERLANIVVERYHIDKVNDKSIEFEYLENITMDNCNDVTGKKMVSFSMGEEVYRQNRFALMLEDVCKILYEKDASILQMMANNNYSIPGAKRIYISSTGADMKFPWQMVDGIYVELNFSAVNILNFIGYLLDAYGIDRNVFSVNVVADSKQAVEDDEDEE